MFTGTDETRGLEEWNVNTIAHLESEQPESLSALWDGGRGVRQNPRIFDLCRCTVIITNSTNKKKWISSLSIRHSFHSLAKEGSLHTNQEVR